jgi:hypothetical protein
VGIVIGTVDAAITNSSNPNASLGTKAGKVAKGAVSGAIAAPGTIAGVPDANMVGAIAATAVEGFVKDAIDSPAPSISPQATNSATSSISKAHLFLLSAMS